jgi:hypothetical protein
LGWLFSTTARLRRRLTVLNRIAIRTSGRLVPRLFFAVTDIVGDGFGKSWL